MAIDAAHRSSIYRKLVPILGEEDANVMMSEFPAVEADELVTRDQLRAELAVTRGDLRAEIGELRTSISSLETRLTLRLGGAIAASTAFLGVVGIFT